MLGFVERLFERNPSNISKRFEHHTVFTSVNSTDDMTDAQDGKESVEKECKDSKEIEQLRRQILETKDLKTRTDDVFLLRFLTARKFDQKRSFKLLKSYYSARKKHQMVFNNFIPSAVKSVLQSGIFELLPQPDQLGRTVLIGRAYKWDLSNHSVIDLLRAILMVLETAMEDERTLYNGVVLIYDSTGLSWRHCLHFTPTMIYLIQLLLEDTFPARFKEWHIVNMHFLAKGLMSVVMPVVRPKLRKRIHLHCSSMDDLHQYISPQVLPVEYGGVLEDYDVTATARTVLTLEETFRKHQECWNDNIEENCQK